MSLWSDGAENVDDDDEGNDNAELEQEEQSAVVVALEINSRVRWDVGQIWL